MYTGTVGNIALQDNIYVNSAPEIFIQDAEAGPLFNPDQDGYYWQLSGTVQYPVDRLGCFIDVSLGDNLTVNDIRCDKTGNQGSVVKRNYLEMTFTMQQMFPLSLLAKVINGSSPLVSGGFEKMGIGQPNNNKFYQLLAVNVYDPDNSDYVLMHLHRCQVVSPFNIQMRFGEPWSNQVTVRAYADNTKPDNQLFATVIRHDPSELS